MADIVSGIGGILVTGLFGNPMIAALFFFFLMVALGVAMRFSLDCWVVTLTPLAWLLMFHPDTQILPSWAWILFAIGLGILLFFGVARMIKNR